MGPPSFFFSPPALPAAWAPRSPPCWSSWRSSVRRRTRPTRANRPARSRSRSRRPRSRRRVDFSTMVKPIELVPSPEPPPVDFSELKPVEPAQAAAPSQAAATTAEAASGTPGHAEGRAGAEFRQRRRRPAGRCGFPADAGRRLGRQAALSSSADAARLSAARRRAQPAGRGPGARAPRSRGRGRRDRAAPAERLPDARSRRHRGREELAFPAGHARRPAGLGLGRDSCSFSSALNNRQRRPHALVRQCRPCGPLEPPARRAAHAAHPRCRDDAGRQRGRAGGDRRRHHGDAACRRLAIDPVGDAAGRPRHVPDAQRALRARAPRPLRGRAGDRPARPGAGARHRPAPVPGELEAWLCRARAHQAGRAAQPAVLRRRGRGGAQDLRHRRDRPGGVRCLDRAPSCRGAGRALRHAARGGHASIVPIRRSTSRACARPGGR